MDVTDIMDITDVMDIINSKQKCLEIHKNIEKCKENYFSRNQNINRVFIDDDIDKICTFKYFKDLIKYC
jgi:hypothetical protein